MLRECSLFHSDLLTAHETRSADWQSAVSQVANLRNSRLPIGATPERFMESRLFQTELRT